MEVAKIILFAFLAVMIIGGINLIIWMALSRRKLLNERPHRALHKALNWFMLVSAILYGFYAWYFDTSLNSTSNVLFCVFASSPFLLAVAIFLKCLLVMWEDSLSLVAKCLFTVLFTAVGLGLTYLLIFLPWLIFGD